MSNIFRHSTSSSALQQAIERATDPNQPVEDWSLIINICDYVSLKEENAKEAMKLIRKRLHTSQSGQGWRVVSLTLTLLEALCKNCGKNFHLQLAHRDFLKELKHLIGPKNNPPVELQKRVLAMIQNWALVFRNDQDLKQIEHFYQECKQQGLEFPPAESEQVLNASIRAQGTIERATPQTRLTSQTTNRTQQRSSQIETNQPVHSAAAGMSPDQLAKLRSELDVVQTNVEVFGEMLLTLQPADENPQDFELLMELHRTCQQMQSRIVELLSQITNDEITSDLLRYNDSFNHSFKLFENYMKERDRKFKNSSLYHRPPSTTTTTKTTKVPAASNDVPSLIQFDDEIPAQPAQRANASANNEDPERVVKELEEWLRFQGDESRPTADLTRREDGTTAAFNDFLQKRASTIPTEASSANNEFYRKIQPISNRIDDEDERL